MVETREKTQLDKIINCPMTASFPQDKGQIEVRKLVKTLNKLDALKQEETSVEVNEECDSLRYKLRKLLCASGNEEESIDEVDGRTEEILKPLVKLYFLKILILDIGISLGDVLTDFAQSINLIFDSNWNIYWTTYHYGLIMLGFIWAPVVPMLLHILTVKGMRYFGSDSNYLKISVKILMFILFFPLLPTFMYLRLLCIRNNFKTNRAKLRYLDFEQKATELKSVAGSIESTLQFTLMLWMMFRRILSLPWDQSMSSSCVEDSLGRVACLPSIPILSMFFSLLSIIKSVFDMNMAPYVNSSLNNVTRSKFCQYFVLYLFPYFLCNVLFRLPAFAFIITFLDYWSIIPFIIMFIFQLAICGIFFIKKEISEEKNPIENDSNQIVENKGFISTEENQNSSTSLLWNGNEWLSKSVLEDNTVDKKEDNVKNEENDKSSFKSVTEENTPLLTNSIAGFFFPVVLSYTNSKGNNNLLKSFEEYLTWQCKVFMVQVCFINVGTLITVFSIFVLITFMKTFNYRDNIFNFYWFSLFVVFLSLYGLVSIAWSLINYKHQPYFFHNEENGTNEAHENSNNISNEMVSNNFPQGFTNALGQNQCTKCDKVFINKKNIWRHFQSVHGGVNYQCNDCDKSFSQKYNLIRHTKNLHEGENKYPIH